MRCPGNTYARSEILGLGTIQARFSISRTRRTEANESAPQDLIVRDPFVHPCLSLIKPVTHIYRRRDFLTGSLRHRRHELVVKTVSQRKVAAYLPRVLEKEVVVVGRPVEHDRLILGKLSCSGCSDLVVEGTVDLTLDAHQCS